MAAESQTLIHLFTSDFPKGAARKSACVLAVNESPERMQWERERALPRKDETRNDPGICNPTPHEGWVDLRNRGIICRRETRQSIRVHANKKRGLQVKGKRMFPRIGKESKILRLCFI